MKKFTLNIGFIIISFAIGLAINSACSDSLDENAVNNTEIKELIKSLQREINTLKEENEELANRVSTLEAAVFGSNNGNVSKSGIFEVDGLLFLPTGHTCSKIKTAEGKLVTTLNEETTEEIAMAAQYTESDAYGRITKIEYYVPSGYDYYRITYTYNKDKTVTETTEYSITGAHKVIKSITTSYY